MNSRPAVPGSDTALIAPKSPCRLVADARSKIQIVILAEAEYEAP